MEPALPVEQPSHVQWVDLLSVQEAAAKDPLALWQTTFPMAHSVSAADSVCALDGAVATDSAAAYFLPAVVRHRVGAAALGPCLRKCWSHPFELGHA